MTDINWLDSAHIQQRLEQVFTGIWQQRLRDMPIVNPALRVQALGFQLHLDNWVGILLTPWFMNLLLLPKVAADWQALNSGDKINGEFPNGIFEFTVGHEPALGRYAACSLYSPMFQFNEQAVAVDTAQAAWQGLFMEDRSVRAALSSRSEAQKISRRDLLRGTFRQKDLF